MIGIYVIKNTKNSKVYIGSSINIKQRFNQHKYLLKKNKSHSPKLQNAYNKYGEEAFIFEAIQYCKELELKEIEKKWIDFYNCVEKGYNCSNDTICSTRGLKHSDKTKTKMSLSQKILSNLPHRKKMSSKIISSYNKSLKGVPKNSAHRKKIGDSNKGKKRSDDDKIKQSIRMKNNPIRYWLGKKRSEESKNKMSKTHIRNKRTGYTNHLSKPILQYELNGVLVGKHASATDCERNNPTIFKRSGIKECLSGRNKSYKNYIWKYAD